MTGTWTPPSTGCSPTTDRPRKQWWAHNIHVGDARATTMAAAGGVNIGQLARERETLDLTTDELPNRAIGVVYHPERERRGNYVPTVLGRRYDAFLWFDETMALRPVRARRPPVLEPETYSSGT